MNALRLSLLALALAVTACGPADASIDGEQYTDESGELTASSHFETCTGKDGKFYFHLLAGNGQKVLDAMCAGGFEGVIAKRADATYRGERTKDWLKIKCIRRQEFVIGGWRPSEKRHRFASLLLGTWDDGKLTYHGRVGTGFDEAEAEALQKALDARARDKSPFESAPRDIARKAKSAK